MNKAIMLRIVNFMLIPVFVVQAATSIIFLAGIPIPDMRLLVEIHEYAGALLIALVIAHLILNWGWVKANILKKRNQNADKKVV